jgi:hypothetical protein
MGFAPRSRQAARPLPYAGSHTSLQYRCTNETARASGGPIVHSRSAHGLGPYCSVDSMIAGVSRAITKMPGRPSVSNFWLGLSVSSECWMARVPVSSLLT